MPSPTAIRGRFAAILLASTTGLAIAGSAHAVEFGITNLVSDGSVPAIKVDPNLINPWGVSFGATTPFWVSDNGAGVATLYNGAGGKLGLTVTVPTMPTGQVFNSTANGFQINGAKPIFIFDTEDGNISGWTGGPGNTAAVNAPVTVGAGAVFKGLALGTSGANTTLFATDFHNGVIDAFTNSFAAPPTTFTDPTVAAGYAPFNAQVLNGQLYVTFALQDDARHDDVAGAGNGYVDVFNLDGTLARRIVSQGGDINSPWGLAIAPSTFGSLAGDLLVGNFGDGTISAYNLTTNAFDGKLTGRDGQPLVIGDLWALTPGNGVTGSTGAIYLTAGLSDEAHGLFAELTAVPEPDAWGLMILGLGLTGAALRASRKAHARPSRPERGARRIEVTP